MGGSVTVGGGGSDGPEIGVYEEPVAPGGCTLLLTLLAGVSAGGSWCAVVGAPGLGLAAAAEVGVDLARLALVPAPGRDWARVVGALLDGFDLVAVRPPARLVLGEARALSARARNQGAVLVSLGPWPGSDLRLATDADVWEGLGRGSGRLRSRRMSIRMSGRGAAGGRPARAELLLPVTGEPVPAPMDRPADLQALRESAG
jgi:hypothetical protein